jgi:hypothetical protein
VNLAGTKYQYQRRLGGGGMAEVYLASTVGAEGFTRPIAIKRVLPSYSQDADFAAMFVNEARLSSLLRHPNIVQVLDFDRDAEHSLYLVMELVEGKDLADVLAAGRLPLAAVVHVIREVLAGLGHAHEMTTPDGRPLGIVHRDVSPHNVLVSWDGAVKVSDFGIAKAMAATGAAASGMIKGKPLYMAPEQVTMPDHVDHRADLFAVGVMLYEMLTGNRVYQGGTHDEVLTDVIRVANGWRQVVPPNVLNPEVPRDVCRVALTLLAADRDQRFATAREAIDALSATASANTRGGELLAGLLAERFPAEAPARVIRRSQAPTVTVGPASARAAQMAAETRTRGAPAVALAASAAAEPPRLPARRLLRLAIAAASIALTAIAIAAVITRRDRSGAPRATTHDAAPGSVVDATRIEPAAGAAPAPAAAVAPDAAPAPAAAPTAAPGPAASPAPAPAPAPAPPRSRHRSRGSGAAPGSTIHDIPLGVP